MIKSKADLVNVLSKEKFTIHSRQKDGGFLCIARWGGTSIRSRWELPYSHYENATAIFFHGLPLLAKTTMIDLMDIGAKLFLFDLSEKIVSINRPGIETEQLFRELLKRFDSYPRMMGYIRLIEGGTDEAAVAGIDEVRIGLRESRPPRTS